MTVKTVVMYQNNARGRKETRRGFQSSLDGNGSVADHSPSRQE